MSGVFGELDTSMVPGSGMSADAGLTSAAPAGGMPMGDMMALVQLPFKLAGANAAKAEALYKQKMQRAIDSANAMRAMGTAQKNIVSLENQKVLSNVDIQANQRKAEAMAKLSAAVTGTEGSTVDQTISQTEVNAALATSSVHAQIEQAINDQLVAVESAAGSITSSNLKPFQSNAMKQMMGAILPINSALFGEDNLAEVGGLVAGASG